MTPPEARPAETFPADVNRDIKALIPVPVGRSAADAFQRRAELLWREMAEEVDESEALEILMRAVVGEATARARDAGSWSAQELFARAGALERAADAMLWRVAEEMKGL